MTLLQQISVAFMLLHVCTHCYAKHKTESRIVNGIETSGTNYPYVVAIQFVDQQTNTRYQACTGTLIRAEYPAAVLTAGHCIYNVETNRDRTYYCDIGRTYPYTDINNDDYTELPVFFDYSLSATEWSTFDSNTKHWSNTVVDYDIGVMLLDGSVENVQPVTLYNPNNATHTIAINCCDDGQILRGIGYGYIDDQQTATDTLRYLQMEYVEDVYNCSNGIVECFNNKNNGFTYSDNVIDDNSQFCTESNDGSMCQGDSGGPLIYFDSNNTIQVGIVGAACCTDGAPNIYMNVGFFYDVIQSILSDETSWLSYVNVPPKTTDSVDLTDQSDNTIIIVPDNILLLVGFIVIFFKYWAQKY